MALSGLMGVCLLQMSVDSAYSRPVSEEHEAFFKIAKKQLAQLHSELLTYIERDTEAYGGVLTAYKLKKSTLAEAEYRKTEIQSAALSAIEIPLKIIEACLSALEPGLVLLPKVKHAVLGDLKIGLLVIKAGIEGSLAAATMNLPLLNEAKIVDEFQVRINELQTKFDTLMANLR